MIIRVKHILPIFAVAAVLIAGGLFMSGTPAVIQNPSVSGGPEYHSMVVTRVNGEVIDKSSNYFTTEGKDWLIGQWGNTAPDGASAAYADQVQIGTGAANAKLDVIDFEKPATWTSIGTGNITTSVEATATATTKVNATQLNVTADAVIPATNTFTGVTTQNILF